MRDLHVAKVKDFRARACSIQWSGVSNSEPLRRKPKLFSGGDLLFVQDPLAGFGGVTTIRRGHYFDGFWMLSKSEMGFVSLSPTTWGVTLTIVK